MDRTSAQVGRFASTRILGLSQAAAVVAARANEAESIANDLANGIEESGLTVDVARKYAMILQLVTAELGAAVVAFQSLIETTSTSLEDEVIRAADGVAE